MALQKMLGIQSTAIKLSKQSAGNFTYLVQYPQLGFLNLRLLDAKF